ncbi:MAG: hypothetical protein V4689_22625 [Verrucomicrobiota bacterium]
MNPFPNPEMPQRFPPPVVSHRDLILTATDHGKGGWAAAGIPYLLNIRGVLQLLTPPGWQDRAKLRMRGLLVITRGRLPCGCDAIELLFPDTGHHLYITAAETNRLPGDPAGKRPWELEVWFPGEPPQLSQRLLAVWRAKPLPHLLGWDGPRPDPAGIPPRRVKQARPHWWPTPQPGGKPGYKTRTWREQENDRQSRWYDRIGADDR